MDISSHPKTTFEAPPSILSRFNMNACHEKGASPLTQYTSLKAHNQMLVLSKAPDFKKDEPCDA